MNLTDVLRYYNNAELFCNAASTQLLVKTSIACANVLINALFFTLSYLNEKNSSCYICKPYTTYIQHHIPANLPLVMRIA